MTGASKQPLWTGQDIAAVTLGKGPTDWVATGVSIDSRVIVPGDLFIALQGPKFDGHDFIANALASGASGAIGHRRSEGLAETAPFLLVEDSLAALQALGAAARDRSHARFAAVTGSVGKTGTKEALRHCLTIQGQTFASAASHNNQWGVPLSLARMPREAEFGIFEIGMNHPGEITPLSRLVRPDVAIVTTIEAAHLGNFDSLEEIAEAKAEIFRGMDSHAIAVLNRDNPFFDRLVARAKSCGISRIISFGRHQGADARLLDYSLHASCSAVSASIAGEQINYCLSLPGFHWVVNSLAILAAVGALGADVADAASQLASLAPMKGRGQRHRIALEGGGSFELIDESYNANPASMTAAIRVLGHARVPEHGRRIAILGDMLELGAAASELHAELAGPLADSGCNLVLTCGKAMTHLQEALPAKMRGGHTATSQALVPIVRALPRDGDVVLVKGSLGSRMAVLVEALQSIAAPPGETLPRAANGD